MPKAILAIRTYPATLIIALLLFVATLVMTATSMGTAGVGGGDDVDGGSGIGGTGRSGEFGGSGFGGTGGPSPFVTSVNDLDPIDQAPSDSSLAPETALSEALADSVEQSSLVIETSSTLASEDIPNAVEPSLTVPAVSLPETVPEVQLAEVITLDPEPVRSTIEIEQAAPNSSAIAEVLPEKTAPNTIETMQQDQGDSAAILASDALNTATGVESVSVKLETAAKELDQEIDRNALPDRIQRPDLPPIQRVRPVDRASIMAPARAQPMRI